MDINDPFGFKKLQTMVARTQKAVNSVGVVSAKLSADAAANGHKPSLNSLAQTMQSAAGNLDKINASIKKVETRVHNVSADAKNMAAGTPTKPSE